MCSNGNYDRFRSSPVRPSVSLIPLNPNGQRTRNANPDTGMGTRLQVHKGVFVVHLKVLVPEQGKEVGGTDFVP